MLSNDAMQDMKKYDSDRISKETSLSIFEEDKTDQQFKDECDINTITRRYGLTGQMPEPQHMPQYGDFSEVTDFHSAMDAVLDAQESFEALPAELRSRFQNDPGEFLEWLNEPQNLDEVERLGLITPEHANELRTPVEPLTPPSPPSPPTPPAPPEAG